ncbi:MAG: MetS family NSS transporter small subunit [Sarcina sp.]
MTTTSWIFFGIGATVLWGGFIVSLTIFIKNEKKLKQK